jgi:hypothetical protein
MFMGAASGEKLFVEDVFSTNLYTATGAAQSIPNGIDLAGNGGLVWIKNRTRAAQGHGLFDSTNPGLFLTPSGHDGRILSTAGLQYGGTSSSPVFTSTGFNLSNDTAQNIVNYPAGDGYTSWSFRKAPNFFDVVTYTGNGGDLTVNHSLGSQPGCIIIKKTSGTGDWVVSHRYNFGGAMLKLNTTDAAFSAGIIATATTFRVFGGTAGNSDSGATYVAYIFAHDSSADGIIQCGTFTTDASANATVDLGWEPQWMLIKRADGAGDWSIQDNMRLWTAGITTGQNVSLLYPNQSVVENYGGTPSSDPKLTSTGFRVQSYGPSYTYIYMAIRRGPMRTPTLGTNVYYNDLQAAGAGFAYTQMCSSANSSAAAPYYTPDLVIGTTATGSTRTNRFEFVSRLTGFGTSSAFGPMLASNQTSTEAANTIIYQSGSGLANTSIPNFGSQNKLYNWFKRAPGFFDAVFYTGTGVARTVNHNLGVVPELMIVKRRNSTSDWSVYSANLATPATQILYLQLTNAVEATSRWNSTLPTTSNFSIGTPVDVNASGATYVAYLFASCAGVSKVGSYTGTGESDGSPASAQTINCGFSNGARFVLIKATSDSGDWYVFDTARGITTTASPWLWLNTTGAQNSGTGNLNYVEPHPTGFTLAHDEGYINACNYKNRNYIFLAIA